MNVATIVHGGEEGPLHNNRAGMLLAEGRMGTESEKAKGLLEKRALIEYLVTPRTQGCDPGDTSVLLGKPATGSGMAVRIVDAMVFVCK